MAEAGVTAIGDNYVQELRALHDEVAGVRWHFIGTLQASSAHHVAALADVVETVAGERATDAARPPGRRGRPCGRRLDRGRSHRGADAACRPEELPAFADLVAGLEGLTLRGLMTLPPIPERRRGRAAVVRPAPRAPRSRWPIRIRRWWTCRWGCRWITRSR